MGKEVMTLHEFNTLPEDNLREELTRCCGSSAWVQRMLSFIPADDLVELLEDAEAQWYKCSPEDWKEAFDHHPKIGDVKSLKKKFANTAMWAGDEQGGVKQASSKTLKELAEANRLYEEKFGYIFIVCASGRSAEEMLDVLRMRLKNPEEKEIRIAADEQNKITKLRLEKLLE